MPFISANVDKLQKKEQQIKILGLEHKEWTRQRKVKQILTAMSLSCWGKVTAITMMKHLLIIKCLYHTVGRYNTMLVTGIDEADIAVLLSTSDFQNFYS